MMGYAVSATTVAGIMNGCKADTTPTGWQPSFLSADQLDLVAELSESILPKTDTPGAKDVFVHRFIDKMLHNFHTKKTQETFLNGLAQFEKDCTEMNGNGFQKCTKEQQAVILQKYDEETKKTVDQLNKNNHDALKNLQLQNEKKTQHGHGYLLEENRPFFALLKEMTMTGYFTSETISTEVLNYDPIPTAYEGCIALPENRRTWAY